jgi:hypothetical protein
MRIEKEIRFFQDCICVDYITFERGDLTRRDRYVISHGTVFHNVSGDRMKNTTIDEHMSFDNLNEPLLFILEKQDIRKIRRAAMPGGILQGYHILESSEKGPSISPQADLPQQVERQAITALSRYGLTLKEEKPK